MLESTYRRFGARVYSLCKRLLGDALEAEAATVRAFVGAGRYLAQGGDDSRTYLYLREMAIAGSLTKFLPPAVAAEAVSPAVTETQIGALRLPLKPALLELLIARLPEAERMAYVLHDVEGLSDEDVATHLRVSGEVERRLLSRARLALRRLWLAQ